jgi:hypothetical protein
MSDAAYELGSRIPGIARLSVAAPPWLIRWILRIVTVGLFGAATAVGVSLGMGAPDISPTSLVHDHAAASDR